MNNENEQIEQTILNAIYGYHGFYPDEPTNEFLNVFTRSWNHLANRIQLTKLNDDKLLSVEIMNAERKKRSLLRSSNEAYEGLLKRIEYIVGAFQRILNNHNIRFTDELETAVSNLKICIDSHCLGQKILETSRTLKQVPDDNQPEKVQEINQHIDGLESLVNNIAFTFAEYIGIRKALDHFDHHGELHRYGDVELEADDLNLFSFNHLTNCSVGELFKMGHDINTSISIRFLSLNKVHNIPQYNAYCRVENEVELCGLHTDNFPKESKNLADRARRLQEKRFKELRSFNG